MRVRGALLSLGGLFLVLMLPLGCSAGTASPPNGRVHEHEESAVHVGQDVHTTDLALDLAALSGTATITVQPARAAGEVVLDVRGLTLRESSVDGVMTQPLLDGGLAHFPVAHDGTPVELVAHFDFPARDLTFDGWMPSLGVSFTWPSSCGNLFPCNPLPDDGVRFTMSVTGAPDGQLIIHPRDTFIEAPSYMPALAVGAYEELNLGRTEAGTTVRAFYLPPMVDLETAQAGTAHLVRVQDFYERRYGPYAFGPDLGAVAVDWGEDSWGGIEAHPYYHVPRFDFGTEEVHAHEAAHAWYGNGVRLACFEDFVLSEGTVTYMAARGLAAAGGPDLWPMYVAYLEDICDGTYGNAVALDDSTCNRRDFPSEWSLVHYMKGACFYEEVADTIGWDALDDVISDFYRAHVGTAARMQEMLDALKVHAPQAAARIDALAAAWLRQEACPSDYAVRCGAHEE